MIDVMAKVIKEVPETILLVLGDRNSFVDELEELILNCKLENNIIFTGYIDRSNMKNYYALANIVVVPSVCFDSFPTVNLEAMSCKKPVITSCFGGGREAVVNEKTGFIINPMNIDIFSNKIIYILKEEEKSIKIGEDGFERIKKYFSEERWINKIISFYI